MDLFVHSARYDKLSQKLVQAVKRSSHLHIPPTDGQKEDDHEEQDCADHLHLNHRSHALTNCSADLNKVIYCRNQGIALRFRHRLNVTTFTRSKRLAISRRASPEFSGRSSTS